MIPVTDNIAGSRRVRRGVFVCVAVLFATIAAMPQSAAPVKAAPAKLTEMSLEQLANLEVTTAAKAPEQVWKTAAAITVITQEDIRRSGATCIPEALRLAPGVEVARIDGNKWSIGIRGFGSRLARSVLVLMDGRSVYTTFLAGTYWEVQDTLLEDVDRIEVIRGPGGTIWGPNAVNGVINIITKKAKDTRGVLASAGGGNVEQGFLNVRYGGGDDKLAYRAYGKFFNRSPEFHADARDFDAWRSGQGGFRVDWDKSDRDSFTFQGDMYDQSAGESVEAVTYNPPASQILEGDARLSGGNVMGRWKRTQGQNRDIQVQAYYDRTNRHELNFGDIRDTFDVDYLQRLPLPGRQELSFGAGMRLSHGSEIEIVSGLTFDPPERTDQLYTVFLQDQIELVKRRLSLTVGTKLVKTNYTGAELEPSVRLLYTPSDTQTFWAAFTRAVRTPADVDRDFNLSGYLGTGPGGLPFFARFSANHDFQSEKLRGYEAGYRRLITSSLYIDLAGFFNQYNDLFSEEIAGALFVENTPAPPHILLPAKFGNSLVATTEGLEVSPEWRPTGFLRLRGYYAFLEMHVKKAPNSADVGSAPGIQGGSPQHQLMLQSSFDLPRAFTADMQLRYVSGLVAQNVPAYTTADASLGWRANENVRLSVTGQNLFQPQHMEFLGDPRGLVGIKRGIYAKVTWTSGR